MCVDGIFTAMRGFRKRIDCDYWYQHELMTQIGGELEVKRKAVSEVGIRHTIRMEMSC